MSKTIKKAFQPIIDLLNENSGATVSDILPHVIELAAAKTTRSADSNAIRNTDGTVVAIFDYYFKRWMPLVGEKAVEFGVKAKSATGLNTMCKEGVSNWTKQQREAKNAEANLLKEVAAGTVEPSEIAGRQEEIEANRTAVIPTELGFDSRDEVEAYLAENGEAL